MGLNARTIASAIAGMTVTGVTIKDVTGIPEQVQPRDCPILFPDPIAWMAGGNGEPSDGPATFGTPTNRMWVFDRVYRYVYLHASAGAGRGLPDQYPTLSDANDAIATALTALDITGVDIKTIAPDHVGILADPAGNNFYGFQLALTFRERVNP